MLWFDEAQDNLVDANVPAWLQVVPSTLRILVHQPPGAQMTSRCRKAHRRDYSK